MSPDKNTPFESELAELPLRSVPPDLRNEILQQAEIAAPRRSWGEVVRWLWMAPVPVRVGVAGTWLIALALRLTTPQGETVGAYTFDELVAPAEGEPGMLMAFNRDQLQHFLDSEQSH